ncbi:MAG: Fic family protein [Rhodoferax sp.]|uniref:Fic family protein n=1 Tax=Rhodoferax sp. TaxID=50421 RepID=UPI0030166D83
MVGRTVGYEFLREQLNLSAFPCARPARIASVTKVIQGPDSLEIPASVAPASQIPLDHVLFALKHEGINLQVLAQALPRIPAAQIMEAFRSSPASKYIRITAYLWEQFCGTEMAGIPAAIGPYVDLFDGSRYITGQRTRNTKWRVDFNGLGNIRYCPTVERTNIISELLEKNTLQRAQEFISGLDLELLDRTMSWSYLSETESSFAIERENPSPSKAVAFTELLKQARDTTPITEEYLVQLQNMTVTNPMDHDMQFRHRVNWLRGPGRGVLGITYVPPTPDLIPEIMDSVMDLLNHPPINVSPIIIGALASFAFVFAHPFMDGNGRLSRFIFHKAVCKSKILSQGLVLPISIAMKRNESNYLQALKSFSVPARRLWDISMIDDENFDLKFKGESSIYRYWDATQCVEFGLKMAQQALELDLYNETSYLKKYNTIYDKINSEIDINNNDLSLMVRLCLQNDGLVSLSQRKKFLANGYKEETIKMVESIATSALNGGATTL